MLQILILTAGAVLVGLDQFTKWLAETYLAGNPPFVLVDGVFELHYIENPGAAFGIFPGNRFMLIAITSVALLALLYALMSGRLGRSKLVIISGTLILAGGVGNLVDRIFRHEVIDFFYFKAINFAIFNVADCFVVIGASLMLLYFLFLYKTDHFVHKAEEDAPSEIEAVREEDVVNGNSVADAPAGESRGQD